MEYEKEYKIMLETWGEDSQIDICIEEMAELTKALCKYKRLKRFNEQNQEKIKSNLENIKEEIADVLNVIHQMAYIFGENEIKDIRAEKVNRTMKKMIKN